MEGFHMAVKEQVIRTVSEAKKASRKMALIDAGTKNRALKSMAGAIVDNLREIKQANLKDLRAAEKAGLSAALIDRLELTGKRLEAMAGGLREVAGLKDPVGEVIKEARLKNGLLLKKTRVPLGVIGIIYESRPNVTAEAAGLCLKSGNAVVLRGGSEAINSNRAIVSAIRKAAYRAGIPEGAIGFIGTMDRAAVSVMSKLDTLIDMLILRGGDRMISDIAAGATVPVMRHGKGVCHVFVDESADMKMARSICYNAKVSRPGVCNAMETLLVHKSAAGKFLPEMVEQFNKAGVEIRGDSSVKARFQGVKAATQKDWSEEYLGLIISVRVVNGLEEAIEHIARYGSGHSDAIVTGNRKNALEFMKRVDSAAVYWNASTRFTDGGEFGLGAEIGISTQKSHARGPMGLEELTSIKYVVTGNGQIRK